MCKCIRCIVVIRSIEATAQRICFLNFPKLYLINSFLLKHFVILKFFLWNRKNVVDKMCVYN